MVSDDQFQKAFRLAYVLHPDPTRELPLRIVIGAFSRISKIQRVVVRRGKKAKPTKIRPPQDWTLQLAVFDESTDWEVDQESREPGKPPQYKPSCEDLLVRYLKLLVSRSITYSAFYVAFGLGCRLHSYEPDAIIDLAPELFNPLNKPHVAGTFDQLVRNRFPGKLDFQQPDGESRKLIYDSLAALTPWGEDHHISKDVDILIRYFAGPDPAHETKRMHAIIDTQCAGFPRLIAEYNSGLPANSPKRLPNPDDNLLAPRFERCLPGNHVDRFTPDPLNGDTLMSLRISLENQLKRNRSRSATQGMGTLRILADGRQINRLSANQSFGEFFKIPRHTSNLDIWGLDDDGTDVLVAVFPLYEERRLEQELDGSDEPLCFMVEIEAGHTFELEVPALPESEELVERTVHLRCELAGQPSLQHIARFMRRLPEIASRLSQMVPVPVVLERAETTPTVDRHRSLGSIPGLLVGEDIESVVDVEIVSEPGLTRDGRLAMEIRLPHFSPAGDLFTLDLIVVPSGDVLGSTWVLRPGESKELVCELPEGLRESWSEIGSWDWSKYPFRFILVATSRG